MRIRMIPQRLLVSPAEIKLNLAEILNDTFFVCLNNYSLHHRKADVMVRGCKKRRMTKRVFPLRTHLSGIIKRAKKLTQAWNSDLPHALLKQAAAAGLVEIKKRRARPQSRPASIEFFQLSRHLCNNNGGCIGAGITAAASAHNYRTKNHGQTALVEKSDRERERGYPREIARSSLLLCAIERYGEKEAKRQFGQREPPATYLVGMGFLNLYEQKKENELKNLLLIWLGILYFSNFKLKYNQ